MRWMILAVASAALLAVPAASTQTLPIRKPADVERTTKAQRAEAAKLQRVARDITALRVKTWQCQSALGVTQTRAAAKVWLLPRSVAYRTWVAKKWRTHSETCKLRLQQRTIPATNDWQTAVRLVQRIYPGTSDWLLYISRREGGHGGFVMNHQGSGAGGWMQFMASTYWAYSDDAFADARMRGFIVDPAWNQWTHPLGQAITAGYMKFTGREGCHWCL